jgi:uncharacterized membrane protein (DUF373 family)
MKVMDQHGMDRRAELTVVSGGHTKLRKYLEVVQDIIVLCLCATLFIAMLLKLYDLGQALLRGTDFSAVVADILFILVLIELFRLLVIYLEAHRISVSTMVEVGIVSTLREVILKGALQVDWRQLLVLCAFILTLGIVLRYAGIRREQPGKGPLADQETVEGADYV